MRDTPQQTCKKKYTQILNSLRVQNRIRTKRHNILHPPKTTRSARYNKDTDRKAHLHRGHNLFYVLRVQFQHPVQYGNFIVP